MQQGSLSLKITDDGSHTIWRDDWGEPFHSIYGAMQESEHVFIETGLNYCTSFFKEIYLLEIGLGTGLNAFLTWLYAEKHQIKITYTAFEPFPIPRHLASQLNYADLRQVEGAALALSNIHDALYENIPRTIGKFFKIQALRADFRRVSLNPFLYHCVFFDAFDPAKDPELWAVPVFKKLNESLISGGVLVTYSAKGQVRRNLKEAGFSVQKLPGPPGKREITRAIKIS